MTTTYPEGSPEWWRQKVDKNPRAAKVWLDSVEGTEADAWQRAMVYGQALRHKRDMHALAVSVEHIRGHLYYLFLEATE